MNSSKINDVMHHLYSTVDELEAMFPGRPFTPDGHMVGSIGECLVAAAYELELMPPSNKGYDAVSPCGKKVEIKATQSKGVGFRSCPEYAIVIKINRDGSFDEYYNGPGALIWEQFEGRNLPSNGQHQISLQNLKDLNLQVSDGERIARVG